MQMGDLKRKPIWTAFMNIQILTPGWASRYNLGVVHLADLQQYILTTVYDPQMTSTGTFELSFIGSSGTAPNSVDLIHMLIRSDAQVICLVLSLLEFF